MQTIGDRIKIARRTLSERTNNRRRSRDDLVTELNWSNNRLYEAGQELTMIAKATGVRLEWLETGKGPMYEGDRSHLTVVKNDD